MDSKIINWTAIWIDWFLHGLLYFSFIGILFLLSPKMSEHDATIVTLAVLFAVFYATYMTIQYGKHEYL
jgi:hypothetical protein